MEDIKIYLVGREVTINKDEYIAVFLNKQNAIDFCNTYKSHRTFIEERETSDVFFQATGIYNKYKVYLQK